MRINKIGKFHNIRIEFEERDLTLKYTTYPSERCTSNVERSLRYAINRPFFLIKFKIQLLRNPGKQCQGCGEGIYSWEIDEPNGEDYKIKVCDGCVSFYDWRGSCKKLSSSDTEVNDDKS